MLSNTIALFVGPSGSGKTTIANYLCSSMGMTQLDSYTTRPPRHIGEPGHIFVTEEEFDQLTDMVGFTLFNGHRYCATSQQVDESDIYVIDVNGVEYFKRAYTGKKTIKVFYFTVPEAKVIQRMLGRGDSYAAVMERIRNDDEMFANALKRLRAVYDDVYEIENVNIDDTAKKIMRILKEE